MSSAWSTHPGLERANDRRDIDDALGRLDQLERVKPSAAASGDFGAWHQQIPLRYYGSDAPIWDGTGYEWVTDASVPGGGYLEGLADGDYFSILVLLEPKGSIWQLNVAMADGPDFGRLSFALTSLEYESASRPSGDPTGKIAPVDGAYGTFNYIDMIPTGSTFNFEGYSAAPTGDHVFTGSIPFIVGGDEGDPLTDFETTTDPYTGFAKMDGGPGWYRLKGYTDGQNASSAGYTIQISDLLLTRRADDNSP